MIGVGTQYVSEWLWGRGKGPADFSIIIPPQASQKQSAKLHHWQSTGPEKPLPKGVVVQQRLVVAVVRSSFAVWRLVKDRWCEGWLLNIALSVCLLVEKGEEKNESCIAVNGLAIPCALHSIPFCFRLISSVQQECKNRLKMSLVVYSILSHWTCSHYQMVHCPS